MLGRIVVLPRPSFDNMRPPTAPVDFGDQELLKVGAVNLKELAASPPNPPSGYLKAHTTGAVSPRFKQRNDGGSVYEMAYTSDIDYRVSKALDFSYTGDGTNDREIDLGDDYDYIEVYRAASADYTVAHLAVASSFRTIARVLAETAAADVRHAVGAVPGSWHEDRWQGKMSGADINKIKLGADGALASGTNEGAVGYRVFALKFANMV